jgi:hypothetical protein
MLLPAAPKQFTPPSDREMTPSERRRFVQTHRTCVYGHRRLRDGPAMSVVYYVPTAEGDLLVSTTAGRAKARNAARDGKVGLCVLGERWPLSYLQVYADLTVERDRDLVVDVMAAVAERMSGQAYGADARPFLENLAEQEQRVVLRCRPYATFAQSPRPAGGSLASTSNPGGPAGLISWNAVDPDAHSEIDGQRC